MATKVRKVGPRKADIRHLPVNSLNIDPLVQRALIPARVKHLAKTFDLGKTGILKVSLRGDGKYYVIDGQHRVEGARAAGHGEAKVKCEVYRDLSRADEALYFLAENDVRAVSSLDKFRVGLTAGDPDCLAVNALVESFGLRVADGGAEGTVACVDRLLKIHRRDPELLKTTLDVATTAWGTRRAAVEQVILAGLANVLDSYNGSLDRAALVKKLSKYKGGPAGLLGNARSFADIRPISVTRAASEIVVEAYNRGRRAGQLPPL